MAESAPFERSIMHGLIQRLLEHPGIGPMVAHRRELPGAPAVFSEPASPLSAGLAAALADRGVGRLFAHQAEALDLARGGSNVLAVTPTASGKTLVFAVPVLEDLIGRPESHALFLYPTKALAQDQVTGLRSLASAAVPLRSPRFEIYDGDTSSARRRKLRADPPEVLVTNPDMLHLGILAHHAEWTPFLCGLRWVVLDELHVYRGVFGAHVHHILKRLRRLCAHVGASPRFLAASATVGNPEEFAGTLAGERFRVVRVSGAPRAPRHVLFVNPVGVSPYTVAVRIIAEAAGAGFRTIAFTKARRVTELLHTWLVRQSPNLATRVAPYRAGYLPEERRAIERRLFRGDLLAVLSTSALELGIDVGGLDVCVLVGYPGSLMSAWQRIGRVGRQGRDALVVLVAMPDALDQYVISHPELFFGERFEHAVLDPWNPIVAGHHMVCAAAEEALGGEEIAGERPRELAERLVEEGRLVRDARRERWYSFRRRPHRDVSVRSVGEPYTIRTSEGRVIGTVDGMRVFHECHPGAIYLHGGQSFRVLRLDTDRREAEVERARVDYYTVVLGDKETEILERTEGGSLGPARTGFGRLKVTVRIRGYQKRRLFGGEPISEHPLEAPPLVFETSGFWIEVPRAVSGMTASREMHFMGGLHAAEHAMIALFPLLAISDRGDVGGISYTAHPQTRGPAVFVYDAVPGGAGLAEQGFRDLPRLAQRTKEMIAACACDAGCPACIQSPRCGNGNKPLDKSASSLLLRVLLGEERIDPASEVDRPAEVPPPECPRVPSPPARRDSAPRFRRHGITRAGNLEPGAPSAAVTAERVVIFDLETQRSAEEVGGWGRVSRMGLALAVVHDVSRGSFTTYMEQDVDRLLLDLVMADRVVGFNIDRFDLAVLSGYTEWDLRRIRSLDLLSQLHGRLGFRLSLGHLAEMNLGEGKAADGLQSLRWWKEGRIDLIERYCRKDVEATRRLWELGLKRRYLVYRDHAGRAVRVPVRW